MLHVTHAYLGLFQMNYLIIEENVDNDPCKFALMSRETSERVILQAANPEIQQAWVQDINQVLDTQRDFLNGMYVRGLCDVFQTVMLMGLITFATLVPL